MTLYWNNGQGETVLKTFDDLSQSNYPVTGMSTKKKTTYTFRLDVKDESGKIVATSANVTVTTVEKKIPPKGFIPMGGLLGPTAIMVAVAIIAIRARRRID